MTVAGQPRVTVAIPTWNRAELLRQALTSALSQTLVDFEIVVSDNGSTDDTEAVVASFGADPRIAYSRLPENIGLHGNLNRCLGLGTAPLVTILQDDDLMLPDNLARKLAAFDRHPEAVLVHGDFRFIDADGATLTEHVSWWGSAAAAESPAEFVRGSMRKGVRVDMTSAVLRRDRLSGERFDPDDGLATDYGFFLRVSRHGHVVHVPEPLTAVRRHGGSQSVLGDAIVLPGGHYAPSLGYTAACRAVNERFLGRFGAELPDAARLRLLGRRWARGELAGVVRTNTGTEPGLGTTLRLTRRAAAIDPRTLLSPRIVLTLGWALLGRPGRQLVRRAVPAIGRRY